MSGAAVVWSLGKWAGSLVEAPLSETPKPKIVDVIN